MLFVSISFSMVVCIHFVFHVACLYISPVQYCVCTFLFRWCRLRVQLAPKQNMSSRNTSFFSSGGGASNKDQRTVNGQRAADVLPPSTEHVSGGCGAVAMWCNTDAWMFCFSVVLVFVVGSVLSVVFFVTLLFSLLLSLLFSLLFFLLFSLSTCSLSIPSFLLFFFSLLSFLSFHRSVH